MNNQRGTSSGSEGGQTLAPREERYGALTVWLYYLGAVPVLPGETLEAYHKGRWVGVRYGHEVAVDPDTLVFSDPATGEKILLPGGTRFRWPAAERERLARRKADLSREQPRERTADLTPPHNERRSAGKRRKRGEGRP